MARQTHTTDSTHLTQSTQSTTIRRHDDLRIPIPGETVAATRFEPTRYDDPLPALLMYVPYPRDDVITYGAYDPLVRYLAARGYEVVVADMVGTGGSTGFLEELFTRREGTEPAAIVEWLAEQPWTNGRVGMFGKSYGGITALDAAAQRPEPLEAIVPIHTPYEGVRNAYTHGGAFEQLNIGMNWLTVMQALEVKPPSWRDTEGAWAEAWTSRLERVTERDPFLFQFLDNGPTDEYWADKRIPVEQIETPTFAVTGWRDSYTRDTFEYVDAIDAPARVIAGPWRHTMPHRGRESAVDFRWQAVRWFDHFLKDADTGVLKWPEIRYWTERDGGREPGAGVWRGRDRWPGTAPATATVGLTDGSGQRPAARSRTADSQTDGSRSSNATAAGGADSVFERVPSDPANGDCVSYALSPDGLVPAAAYDAGEVEREYAFDHAVGFASIDPSTATLESVDTAVDDARSVTFESAPLDAPLELTGSGHAALRLSATAADFLVVVRLSDVAPDGSATPLTRGIRRTDDAAIESPDEPREVTVPLQPRSRVVEAGHRLRVSVSAAYYPLVLPSREDGVLTLHSRPDAPSQVVVPGRSLDSVEFADGVEMAPPVESLPVASSSTDGRTGSWTVSRERGDGDVVRFDKSTSYGIDVPHAERVTREESYTAAIDASDPTSAVAESEVELAVEWATSEVRVVAANRISPDVCEVTTRVFLDERPVLDHTWIR